MYMPPDRVIVTGNIVWRGFHFSLIEGSRNWVLAFAPHKCSQYMELSCGACEEKTNQDPCRAGRIRRNPTIIIEDDCEDAHVRVPPNFDRVPGPSVEEDETRIQMLQKRAPGRALARKNQSARMSPLSEPDVWPLTRGDVTGSPVASRVFPRKNEDMGTGLQLCLVAFAYLWSRDLGGKCMETSDVDFSFRWRKMTTMLMQLEARCYDGN
ncbi:uncharacterized protein EV420DRAFT_1485527 [Desarmillaria tabescens]|uniref:Uncharacterized protein n=1 Tax=Armillaria tabescens TaxID=1929756 RepID=A0AA39JFQ5_ARMTA|nr:uncharacterized protein EV420DRAFT_1485527 [Desarmillaria tabescens]KAK0441788.1 hypothetical protein EV420DRAFT_1485527 [Desarmillaria tabescens]